MRSWCTCLSPSKVQHQFCVALGTRLSLSAGFSPPFHLQSGEKCVWYIQKAATAHCLDRCLVT